jgi:signal transduction histidine kinase
MSSSAHSLARVLSSLAQTLESAEGRERRVQQALRLLGKLVPYERCAVLSVAPGVESELFVLPDTSPAERAALQQRLSELLALITEPPDPKAEPTPPLPSASHLSVPLIGLDQVVGLLLVEHSSPEAYDGQELQILAVVASQLGNYLTLVRLLAEQQRVNAELQRTSTFQEMLVGIVGHDLRNPLSAITMAASLLLRRTEDERTLTTLGRIISSANRAARITRNLLDLTRARLGAGIPIERQRVNLGVLLQEALSESRLTHPERTIELGALPHEPLWAEVDADRLAQVLGNLLSNAATYSPPGTPVRLSLEHRGEWLQMDVHNEGPPIPPDVLRHIFDPFKRGGSTDRQGLGLGLYIVQALMQAHGGRVEVRSREREGTTFRLLLPCSSAPGTRDPG